MKKTMLFLTGLLLAAAAFAQGRVVERTYIATDRDVYVAGDVVWYSAFCLDAGRGTLSPISSVGYVELHEGASMVASGKFALQNGRGAGSLTLPASLPTGNYRLVAYTTQNRAERDYDYTGLASKTVSVFNVLSNERVKDGVEVVGPEEYAQLAAECVRPEMTAGGGTTVGLSWEDGVLTLVNPGDRPVTLSLSASHDDGILPNANPTIADFTAACRWVGPRRFDNFIIPEYEGEIIRGHVTGFSQEMIPLLTGKSAFISTPSEEFDVYTSLIDEKGRVEFFTGNIYGNKEYVCEIAGIDPSLNCFIELESPFVGAPVAPAAKLPLSEALKDRLLARSVAMQVERQFTADTLLDPLPVATGVDFGNDAIVYPLDDYTRFTTMEEVLVEFVQEMRARRDRNGKRIVQIRLKDGTEAQFSNTPTLMMIDGVPVFDQQKILDYDPLLVEQIRIYPHTCYIGSLSFEGVANFVTYKHNLPAFKFGGNVRVIDYDGVAWPTAFTGAALAGAEGYPDYRQTIFWHPLLELAPGETLSLPVRLPDYKGRFNVVAEGLSAAGEPLIRRISFEVK